MEPTKQSVHSAAQPAGMLDLTRLTHLLLRGWWLPALGLLLGVGASWYYLSRTPRTYTATGVLQVAQTPQAAVKFQDASGTEDYRSPEAVKTFEQVLTSGTLLLRVIQANHLETNPTFAPPKPDGAPYTDSELIDRLATRVSVAIRRGTRLIDINVDDHDPALACKLAQSLIDQFQRLDMDQKLAASRARQTLLAAEEQRLRANLEKSEGELEKYRTDNQQVSLEEKENIVVARLKQLNDQVTEAKGKRVELEADIARIAADKDASPETLLELKSISSVPAVADLVKQINAKQAEFAAIKERYLYKHIKYIEAQSALDKLHAALAGEIANAAASLNTAYQAAREDESKLTVALREQETAALKLDSVAIPYNALLRQVETDRSLYANILTRMKEVGLDTGISAGQDLQLVQAPTVPYRPSKPSRLKLLAIGAVGGTFLGALAILLVELVNQTLLTVDQAERLLDLPLLAGVPELRRRGTRAGLPLLIGKDDAPQREAFRTLRTTLTMFKDLETRSFLFTSAIPAEGKSFCSLNFAATLARQGCHTLLIAADLRRQDDYSSLLVARDRPGLGDCLSQNVPLAQAVQPTSTQNLFICPAGRVSGDPAGLLAGSAFADLLRHALTVFDRVVVDSPPINAVADALLIAPHTDAVCLVVRACHTHVNAVVRARRTLARTGVTPVGFVFNRLSSRLGYRRAYYDYSKGYLDHATAPVDTPLPTD